MDCSPTRLLCPRDFPSKNSGVGCHFLLQGDLPKPGIKLVSPAWQADFSPLSHWGSPLIWITEMVKNPPAMQVTWVWSLGWEDPLEKGTATYSSILAWRIPWTEEPGRIRSMGSQSQTWLSDFHFTSPISKVYQAGTYETVCCEGVISKILIRCIWEVGKPGRSLGSGLKQKVYCTTLRMTSKSTQQQIHNCPRLTAMNNRSGRKLATDLIRTTYAISWGKIPSTSQASILII